MIEVRTSNLDLFRRMVDDDRCYGEVTPENFVAQIQRKFQPSVNMDMGSALHYFAQNPYSSIQNPPGSEHWGLHRWKSNEAPFREIEVAPELLVPLFDAFPAEWRDHCVWEIEMVKVYDTSLGPVRVTGHCDGLYAVDIVEMKTTSKVNGQACSVHKASLQPNVYMDILDCDNTHYFVVEIKIKAGKAAVDERPELEAILGIERFTINRGSREINERHVMQYLEQFVRYVYRNNLQHLFPVSEIQSASSFA